MPGKPHRLLFVTSAVCAVVSACAGARTTPNDAGRDRGDARPFAPGVVSRDQEFMATFEPDGRTVYTVRRIFEQAGQPGAPPQLTILTSRQSGDGWTEPVPAAFSGRWRDIDPVVSPDGSALYFNSTRPGPGRDSSATDFDVWMTRRTASGWGEPVRLPAPINTTISEVFASVTRDGTLYFQRAGGRPRESIILRARPAAGGYAPPETLSTVNDAPQNASNPFIAPDESFLVFVAERPGGFGDSDLYVTWRDGAGWTPPRNLGPQVNTPLAEFAPSVSPDGRRLYFTRMERGTDVPVRRERLMWIEWKATR